MADVTFRLLELEQNKPVVYVDIYTGNMRRRLKIAKTGISWIKSLGTKGWKTKGSLIRWDSIGKKLYDETDAKDLPKSATSIVLNVLEMDGKNPAVSIVAKCPKSKLPKEIIGTLRIGKQGLRWLPHGKWKRQLKGWGKINKIFSE